MDGPPDGLPFPPWPDAYGELARPGLAKRLKALGLAVTYHRAQGDRVWWRDPGGQEREAWDFLGGYGANLLGHHHPLLVAALQRSLASQQPVLAQASWRPATGRLAASLSHRLQQATGDAYVVTLASTGAEAVEAAWKAGLLKRHRRHEAFLAEGRRAAYALRQDAEAWASLAPEAGRLLPALAWSDLEGFLRALEAHNRLALEAPPLALALERSFHGKTGAATQFTHKAAYRLPFLGSGPETWFLSFEDPEAWRQALQQATPVAWLPQREGGRWRLVARPLTRVALALLEPIQGEGGIHVLGQPVAAAVRLLAKEHGFLFAYDEIQAGLGRSGTWLASEPLLAPAEAYLFGKALGGGLAKVSAFAWRQADHDEDFGLLHTSTFAEDEPSSELACQALDLIEGQGVPERCRRLGEALAVALRPLLARHPEVFVELRGRGLMQGLAFAPQADNPSNAIRMLADQGLLGYAVAAYLLHEEGLRVAPTLSADLTMRLEPSAFLPEEAIARLAEGLDRVAAILKGGDVARLTRHVVGLARPLDPTPPLDRRGEAVRREAPRCAKRVAFIGHFIQAEDAALWDPGLAAFGPEELKRYQLAAHRVLGPTIYDQLHVQGAEGEEVHLSFVGLNLTSKSIEAAMRAREGAWVAQLVLDAALKAVEAGATMIGLGGYTSIVTDNGRSLLPHLPPGVGVTTGNAYTVAVGMQALRRGAEALGLPWAEQQVAVVGGAGNIGQVHARLLGQEVGGLLLLARPGGLARLHGTAALLAQDAALALASPAGPSRFQARLLAWAEAQGLAPSPQGAEDFGRSLASLLQGPHPAGAPLRLSEDPASLSSCQVGVACSNAAQPVVMPEHLPEGPSLWCDLAVPADVAPEAALARPGLRLLRGGLVAVPHDPSFRIAGIPLPPGQAFACMSETLVLGLVGHREAYTVGPVEPWRVRQIEGWARCQGFTLGADKLDRSF